MVDVAVHDHEVGRFDVLELSAVISDGVGWPGSWPIESALYMNFCPSAHWCIGVVWNWLILLCYGVWVCFHGIDEDE